MGKGFSFLQAVIFDWAGTTVDWGCQAPVLAFQKTFAEFSVPITSFEAREPMGLAKRDHVAALCGMPRIHASWLQVYGHPPEEGDIDRLYHRVTSLMVEAIKDSGDPLPGVVESVAILRQRGLRIGSCTGYPREVAVLLAQESTRAGYSPDVLLCANDVPNPRPGPGMCEVALKQLGVADPALSVKIGDTVNDMAEGRAAGMWTIGITITGSLVGLPPELLLQQDSDEQDRLHHRAGTILQQAGAHFVARSVGDCLPLFEAIDGMLGNHLNPNNYSSPNSVPILQRD